MQRNFGNDNDIKVQCIGTDRSGSLTRVLIRLNGDTVTVRWSFHVPARPVIRSFIINSSSTSCHWVALLFTSVYLENVSCVTIPSQSKRLYICHGGYVLHALIWCDFGVNLVIIVLETVWEQPSGSDNDMINAFHWMFGELQCSLVLLVAAGWYTCVGFLLWIKRPIFMIITYGQWLPTSELTVSSFSEMTSTNTAIFTELASICLSGEHLLLRPPHWINVHECRWCVPVIFSCMPLIRRL